MDVDTVLARLIAKALKLNVDLDPRNV